MTAAAVAVVAPVISSFFTSFDLISSMVIVMIGDNVYFDVYAFVVILLL